LETWLRNLPAGAAPRAHAPWELQAVPIAAEAGDLIIWHQALPHAATPNPGRSPRVVQYLNMFPACHEINSTWQ
jgi:ectoine hydroxylase-related dioxygenase (phytanoyl-CoA dioxygenase family)